MEIYEDELTAEDKSYVSEGIGKYRRWFREAVDAADKWREEAQEDYNSAGAVSGA